MVKKEEEKFYKGVNWKWQMLLRWKHEDWENSTGFSYVIRVRGTLSEWWGKPDSKRFSNWVMVRKWNEFKFVQTPPGSCLVPETLVRFVVKGLLSFAGGRGTLFVSLQIVIWVIKSSFSWISIPVSPRLKYACWSLPGYQRSALGPGLSPLPAAPLAWMWETKAVSISWAVRWAPRIIRRWPSPNSTSTQGSEPSCLTSAITEQLRLVERTFSLLTAWRKVLVDSTFFSKGQNWTRTCLTARSPSRARAAAMITSTPEALGRTDAWAVRTTVSGRARCRTRPIRPSGVRTPTCHPPGTATPRSRTRKEFEKGEVVSALGRRSPK